MKFVSLFLLSFGVFQLFGQDAGTIENVSPAPKPDTSHSVKKAVIFSAVLPGSGQVYNHLAMPKGKKRAFWKVPLIYAGLGVTGFYMIQNNALQKSLKAEYTFRRNSGFTEILDARWEQYDDQGVLTLYEQHQSRRDLFLLAFGAVYILQVVDAAVEAHFVTFDISEDLSMSIRPTMMTLRDPGLKLSFNFR